MGLRADAADFFATNERYWREVVNRGRQGAYQDAMETRNALCPEWGERPCSAMDEARTAGASFASPGQLKILLAGPALAVNALFRKIVD